MTDATAAVPAVYAGFWRRLVAYLLDYTIFGLVLMALFALLTLALPGLPKVVTPELPFDMLTTDKTLDEKITQGREGAEATTITEKIVERTVLGLWTNTYRVIREVKVSTSDAIREDVVRSHWQQIDPVTRLDIETTDLGTIGFFLAFLYFAAMESSRHQATLGKLALGIKVTDRHGARLSFPRALLRNVAKIISMIMLGIGFLMAGWTRAKQGLHDIIADTLVVSRW